eukprot:GHVL01035486.1.p1 GENE.GHVL01035486.1~~GHVL01035486.1.p1  ORF type:complete len:208 (-),score=39.22 GHVL01035486.1:67-690(-)
MSNYLEILNSEKKFDRESLPILIEHLNEQISNKTYNLESNLAILKLYSLYPADLDEKIIKNILIKCIMHSDALVCRYMIPLKIQQGSTLAPIINMCQLLEMTKFLEFWEYKEGLEAAEAVPDFTKKIRNSICSVIGITYYTLPLELFSQLVNLPDPKLTKNLCEEQGWRVEGSTVIVRDREEQEADKKNEPILTIAQLQKVISTSHA